MAGLPNRSSIMDYHFVRHPWTLNVHLIFLKACFAGMRRPIDINIKDLRFLCLLCSTQLL